LERRPLQYCTVQYCGFIIHHTVRYRTATANTGIYDSTRRCPGNLFRPLSSSAAWSRRVSPRLPPPPTHPPTHSVWGRSLLSAPPARLERCLCADTAAVVCVLLVDSPSVDLSSCFFIFLHRWLAPCRTARGRPLRALWWRRPPRVTRLAPPLPFPVFRDTTSILCCVLPILSAPTL
jgi:hypothetical protein